MLDHYWLSSNYKSCMFYYLLSILIIVISSFTLDHISIEKNNIDLKQESIINSFYCNDNGIVVQIVLKKQYKNEYFLKDDNNNYMNALNGSKSWFLLTFINLWLCFIILNIFRFHGYQFMHYKKYSNDPIYIECISRYSDLWSYLIHWSSNAPAQFNKIQRFRAKKLKSKHGQKEAQRNASFELEVDDNKYCNVFISILNVFTSLYITIYKWLLFTIIKWMIITIYWICKAQTIMLLLNNNNNINNNIIMSIISIIMSIISIII